MKKVDLLLWLTVGIIAIGFVGLASIKRKLKTTQSIVWWIVGTTGILVLSCAVPIALI
jgi:hypothetical protein